MSTSQALHVTPVPAEQHVLPGIAPDEPNYVVDGALLGRATSHKPTHVGHVSQFMDPREGRCSACRWFDVMIFKSGDEYVVYTAGFSAVPGETTIPKVQRTTSAYEVVELLTVRNSKDGTLIPRPNARALAQAAAHDAAVQDAYVNRATV